MGVTSAPGWNLTTNNVQPQTLKCKCMQTETLPISETQTDFLPLLGTDHIEFYVGNAKQSTGVS